jgi:hypothetical protein
MIFCKELNQNFPDHASMYRALVANKAAIISLKKAAIKTTDPLGVRLHVDEAMKEAAGVSLSYGDYVYPVINTTNYLDSHNDLHIDGIWNKSVKEQQGKIYYIVNHDLALGKVISYPKEVEMMVKEITWKSLGKPYEGMTQALIFKSRLTEKSNRDAYLAFRDGEEIQQSVRMEHVNIDLAIDSDEKDLTREKAMYDKFLKVMVNPEVAKERGYFWIVSEAKIYKEGSAVLFGSNDATGVLYNFDTGKNQPTTIQPVAEPVQPSQFNIKSLLNSF